WYLATALDPKDRDATAAVRLARQAIAVEPSNANYWNTLGAAQYQAGDPRAAIEALEKALQLRGGGISIDWFFLAMAHSQLGDKKRARAFYDLGVTWMRKHQPENETLQRFRAEAEAVVERAEKP